MIRKILIFSAWFIVIAEANAQQLAMKSHLASNADEYDFGKSIASGRISASAITPPVKANSENANTEDVNYLPLFGGFEKTFEQKQKDNSFISECENSFLTKKEASEFFSKMGWTYLEDGEKINAIHRFNLSYLLDSTNIDSFWGLGVIEYQNNHFENAIDLMDKGLAISAQNYVLMVDLATIHIKNANNKSRIVESAAKARMLLDKAIFIQPEYENSYKQLTLLNILENKIDDAWSSFHKGYEINPNAVNETILAELLSRKADPKGLFK